MSITLEISMPPRQVREVETLMGSERLYRKGTSPEWYLDLPSREQADLLLANLNLLPGLRCRILGEPPPLPYPPIR